jgi:hypothetical protein
MLLSQTSGTEYFIDNIIVNLLRECIQETYSELELKLFFTLQTSQYIRSSFSEDAHSFIHKSKAIPVTGLGGL